MSDSQPPFEYLVTSSREAVEGYELSRLNRIANLRKELRQIVDEWIAAETDARVARWILDCRRALEGDSESPQLSAIRALPADQTSMLFPPLRTEASPADAEAHLPLRKASHGWRASAPDAASHADPLAGDFSATNDRAVLASKDAKTALRLLERLAPSGHAEGPQDALDCAAALPRKPAPGVPSGDEMPSHEGARNYSATENETEPFAEAMLSTLRDRDADPCSRPERRNGVRGAVPIRSPLPGRVRHIRRLASAS
jgi:hypothetical protein